MFLVVVPFYQLIAKRILYIIPIGEKIFLVWNEYAYIKINTIIMNLKVQSSNWNFHINLTEGFCIFIKVH